MVLYNSLFCLSVILSMIFYDFPVWLRNQLISAGSDPSNPYLKPCIVLYYRHFSTNSKVKSCNMNTSFVRLGLRPFRTNKTGKTDAINQGSEAAPQPRISLSFKPACEQKKKFLKEGLSTKETVLYIQLNFIVIK